MMDTRTAQELSRLLTAARGLAAIAALASSAYIVTYYLGASDQSDREVTASGMAGAFNVVIAVALVGLAVTVPVVLSAWPRVPVILASAALAFTGATMLAFGTIGSIFADSVSDALWEDVPNDRAGSFLLLFLPKMVTGLLGFVGLAVTLRRRGTPIPLGLNIVLVLAGLALAVPPPPPGALVASVAMLWALLGHAVPPR